MNEPQPSDFGLTDDALQRHARFDDISSYRIGMGIGGTLGVLPCLQAALKGEFVIAFVMLFGVGIGVLFFGSLLGSVAAGAFRRATNPEYKRYLEYKSALEAHRKAAAYADRLFWLNLSGEDFEKQLARVLREADCQVSLTPRTGDQGIDLVIKHKGKTYLIQCKAHASPVGPSAARELYGTLMANKADGAILATLTGWTQGTANFVSGKPLALWNLAHVLNIQEHKSLPWLYLPEAHKAPQESATP